MEDVQIIEGVDEVVQRWITLQENRNLTVRLSRKAKDFLVEVIGNIQQDPSESWEANEFSKNSAQELAISLIPNALNEILPYHRYNRSIDKQNFKISTWEIWHAMTPILSKWCFIPKDI